MLNLNVYRKIKVKFTFKYRKKYKFKINPIEIEKTEEIELYSKSTLYSQFNDYLRKKNISLSEGYHFYLIKNGEIKDLPMNIKVLYLDLKNNDEIFVSYDIPNMIREATSDNSSQTSQRYINPRIRVNNDYFLRLRKKEKLKKIIIVLGVYQ